MIFFTADHHFGHANVIHYSGRPFRDLPHMHEVMIERWNSVVKPNDTVYHLGDIFLCSQQEALRIRARLNGNILLILGNHDKVANSLPQSFGWIKDLYYLRHENRRVVLCHYAMRTWRGSQRGSWHLHGHSHGALKPIGYSADVGVDVWDYRPVSFARVEAEMVKRGPGLEIDHHRGGDAEA